MYVGIDTGDSGALAILTVDGEVIIDNDDKYALVDYLHDHKNKIKMAYLEKVNALPKQGVVSTFKFGTNFGWWQGVLEAYGIPYKLIRPQEWQKPLTLPKDKKARKKAINEAARRLYPHAELVGIRGGIKDGRSDALMIATYCKKEES